ncbi:uncharacterized protein [Primulina eburnea]|uniref:uncharacterized protein n=1 Tax=Primulina eburnea TaxID=1245227 RepID=UPI003C6C16CB
MNAPEEERNWTKPPTGFMKCNVAAAIFRETGLIGYAAVVRDSKDSKTVVETVHANAVDRSEFGTIIGECRSLLSRERYYRVQFRRRQANMFAHNLARAAISHASPCVLL